MSRADRANAMSGSASNTTVIRQFPYGCIPPYCATPLAPLTALLLEDGDLACKG